MDDLTICNLEDPFVIQAVWEKGIVVNGYNQELYRHDFAGAWISRNAYGDPDSVYGWEIDHVYPKSKGGDDHFVNLRPMNIRNNRSKGDDYPRYRRVITASDNRNEEKTGLCTVHNDLQVKLSSLFKIPENL